MANCNGISYIAVLTTLGSPEEAKNLVGSLVKDRLIACGTIVDNVSSIYRWKGNIEESSEVQVVLKTRSDLWDKLVSAVRELHPYDVPELISLPILDGLPEYLEWLSEQTKQEKP